MRLIMWTLTIAFLLAGLALRADGPWLGGGLGDYLTKGCFFLAALACPFLWTRSYGFVPAPLQIPGKERLMIALAMILAIPLVMPWH